MMRNSKLSNIYRNLVCSKNERYLPKYLCCNSMSGFLGCGGNGNGNGSGEDGNGTDPIMGGYVIFPHNNHEEGFNVIKPNIIRYIVTATNNIDYNVARVRWYRQHSVLVILCLQDKYNPEGTPELARQYARRFREGVIFSFWNEGNLEFQQALDEGWSNKIEPGRFFNIYKTFREYLHAIDPAIKTTYGGLAACRKHDLPLINHKTYREALANYGIVPMLDFWNFHTYDTKLKEFYSCLNHINKLDRNKPIILGEFGTGRQDEDNKIKYHKLFVDKCILNRFYCWIAYAWECEPQFDIKSRRRHRSFIAGYKRI